MGRQLRDILQLGCLLLLSAPQFHHAAAGYAHQQFIGGAHTRLPHRTVGLMRADISRSTIPTYFIYFCYGTLVAFLVYSLFWWSESRETQTYGMKNTTTSITLVSTRPEESKEKQVEVAKELRTFLKSKKVGLVKQSEGDGPPSITVFDPDRQLSWAAPLSSEDTPEKGIFAISGSYSASTWISSKTVPLAPPETEVRGIISVPGISSTSNLQFVEQLGTGPLGTGTIQLGTTDTAIVAHAVEIMEKSGSEAVNIHPAASRNCITAKKRGNRNFRIVHNVRNGMHSCSHGTTGSRKEVREFTANARRSNA